MVDRVGSETGLWQAEQVEPEPFDLLDCQPVVGVDVQQDLSKRGSLGSATDILLQINNFRTVEAMKSKSNKTDLYIRPNMAPYSIIDFDKGAAIVAEGARAALLQENALLELSKNQLKKTTIKTTNKNN